MDASNHAPQAQLTEPITDQTTAVLLPETSLSLPRKAEIWSGRVAMVGVMTTVMAIVFKAAIYGYSQ